METKTSRKTIQEITNQFDLGNVQNSMEMKDGIVNFSYNITTTKGKFVFQRLSEIFDERTIQDYQDVQSYLRTNGLHVPVLLHSIHGKPYYRNSHLWRVFEYIPNDGFPQQTPEVGFELGKTLGKFHRLMAKSSFKPRFTLDGFHNTKQKISELEETYSDLRYREKHSQLEGEYQYIISRIKNHFLPENLEKTIIHGDPNFENFLTKDGKVISLLDLDTLMEASPLIDLGDALRSWCQTDDNKFNPIIFDKALEGYNEENSLPYDKGLVKSAVGLITLELAARFLTDYFKEEYFAWDNSKYKSSAEHNLERTRHCLRYHNDFSIEFAKRRNLG